MNAVSTTNLNERESEPLLQAAGLVKRYPLRTASASGARELAAVDGVSFDVPRGSTLALVGESGSGKTTIGRLVLRLEEPDAGSIRFDGEDWLALSGRALRRKRRDLQIVFQDPLTSLNPRMRVGDQVAEPLRLQRLVPRPELRRHVEGLLAEVGLEAETFVRFPSELSGGQRQRVAIARALATRPRLVVCDEPVSALDASIGAQIVNLLTDLQQELGLSYLFISHDVALVSRLADRIAVVYLGRIVEEGPPRDVVRRPLHPYTAALLSAVPDPDAVAGHGAAVLPEVRAGSAESTRAGCAFAARCPIVRERCRFEIPPLAEVEGGRAAACFYPGELPGPLPEPHVPSRNPGAHPPR